jgi:hypothetical protein
MPLRDTTDEYTESMGCFSEDVLLPRDVPCGDRHFDSVDEMYTYLLVLSGPG